MLYCLIICMHWNKIFIYNCIFARGKLEKPKFIYLFETHANYCKCHGLSRHHQFRRKCAWCGYSSVTMFKISAQFFLAGSLLVGRNLSGLYLSLYSVLGFYIHHTRAHVLGCHSGHFQRAWKLLGSFLQFSLTFFNILFYLEFSS